ncbi:hypothetical protein P7K49_028975, partial [Saguinus oedipus]
GDDSVAPAAAFRAWAIMSPFRRDAADFTVWEKQRKEIDIGCACSSFPLPARWLLAGLCLAVWFWR